MLNKSALFILLIILAIAGVGYARYAPSEGSKSGAGTDEAAAPIEKAEFSFAIQDISRSGNVVSFTIPENARQLEKKADAVVLSGLYANDQKKSEECPVVQSTAVDTSPEDYDLMSGRARVNATFDKEEDARAAEEAGCLLINDPA